MHPAIAKFEVKGYTVNSTPLKAGKNRSYDAKRKFLLKKFIPKTNNIWEDMLKRYNSIKPANIVIAYTGFIKTFGAEDVLITRDDIKCIFEKISPLTLLSVVKDDEVVAVASLDIRDDSTVHIILTLKTKDAKFAFVKLITDHFINQRYKVTISPVLGMPVLVKHYIGLEFKQIEEEEIDIEGYYSSPIYAKLPPPKANAKPKAKAKPKSTKAADAKAAKLAAAAADKAAADKAATDKAAADKAAADKAAADKAAADKAATDKAAADKAKADKAKADKAAGVTGFVPSSWAE